MRKQQQNYKTGCICGREETEETYDLCTGPAHVKFHGNQTGKGGDGGAQTADVDTGQHLAPLVRKSGQYDRCRYIADHLTGADCGKQRVFLQQVLQETADSIHTTQVLRYRKETDEGEQQHIVDFLQQLPVNDQQNKYSDSSCDGIRYHSENGEQAQNEKRKIDNQFLDAPDTGAFQLLPGQFTGQQRDGGQRKNNQTDSRQGQRDREEVTDAHVVKGIQIKILRIAYRRCHAAEVRGDGLKDGNRNDLISAAQLLQQHEGKGYEDDQCHIIRDEHGTEEGEQHQCHTQDVAAVDPVQQQIGQPVENPDGFQPCYNRHQAQQQTQYTEINVVQVFPIRRDDAHGQNRTDGSNTEDGLFRNEILYLFQHHSASYGVNVGIDPVYIPLGYILGLMDLYGENTVSMGAPGFVAFAPVK